MSEAVLRGYRWGVYVDRKDCAADENSVGRGELISVSERRLEALVSGTFRREKKVMCVSGECAMFYLKESGCRKEETRSEPATGGR